jgi:hypothetical protein
MPAAGHIAQCLFYCLGHKKTTLPPQKTLSCLCGLARFSAFLSPLGSAPTRLTPPEGPPVRVPSHAARRCRARMPSLRPRPFWLRRRVVVAPRWYPSPLSARAHRRAHRLPLPRRRLCARRVARSCPFSFPRSSRCPRMPRRVAQVHRVLQRPPELVRAHPLGHEVRGVLGVRYEPQLDLLALHPNELSNA